ncbi:MAG TPA: polysaccharide biosynthesis tyrosine autokinase [Candidatus Acidoferrales bacterium]|nr:polysaccharide biosynthesis tyrosine autokinase [Candidatus Acidoferrales bacterium]
MSRDFELLRKVEERSKGPAGIPRRQVSPGFGRHGDVAELPPPLLSGTRDSDWLKAFTVVQKRWRVAATFTLIVVTGAALIALLVKPEYQPVGRLEIDPPGSETFTMQANGSPPSETQYLETRAQNLQSDDLAIAVIRKLGLDRNSDFNSRVPPATDPAHGLRLSAAESAALQTFRSRLKVVHDPTSHMISVSVIAHERGLAASVTNALMQTFIDRSLKMRHDEIASSRAWLQGQLDDISAKVEQSNRDLAAFQKRTGVAEIDEARNTFGDLMTDLNRQMTQVQSERIQLESYLQKARQGGVDSLPQVRENPVVQKLTENLAEARSQLSQDLVIYGVNHPNTRKLQNQVDELGKQLSNERKEALDQLRVSYNAARARERLMAAQKKEASKTISDMAEYNTLKKQAQAQTSLYNTLLARIEEAGIAAASQSSNFRIVDFARVLDRPTRPHPLRYLAFGLTAGLMGGIVLAFLREKMSRPLRSPQDIRDWSGIPSVSLIPEFASNGSRGVTKLLKAATSSEGPAKFLVERPHSPESEAMRALQANIILAKEGQPQALLVTSSLPGEGKTTVAVNLALALSQSRRTCLVDADLRRPCVARSCGVDSSVGLGDVLLGSVPLMEAVVAVRESPHLSVLPGGEPSDERAHLVAGTAMDSIMESLRAQFDFIVLDSSPIIPYAEGRALSTMTDGIIFVTRSGITPGPAMARSMELLSEVRSPRILKVVLNAHDFPAQDYYYYSYKRS